MVTGTFERELPASSRILEIHLQGRDDSITATPNHPFWSVARSAFVPIEQFTVGDELRTAAGNVVRIASIQPRAPPAGTKVYNLEVAGEHVYYVGSAGVLVHNACAPSGNFWKDAGEINGKHVYQRDDLIDLYRLDSDGNTNLGRMLQGNAPLDSNMESIELHHLLQTDDGPIAEVTKSFHRKYDRVLHINGKDVGSAIDRSAFGRWREAYWENRARDMIGLPP